MLKLRIDIDVVWFFMSSTFKFRSKEYIVILGYGAYSDTGLNQEVSPEQIWGEGRRGGGGGGAFQLIEKKLICTYPKYPFMVLMFAY